MKPPRVLFVLSADFGEYVTASLFSRGQPLFAHYALPRRLARYAPAARNNISAYDSVDDVPRLAAACAADVVVLASGYLFPVNGIAGPDALGALVERLKAAGCAVATTDPWLGIWTLRPGSRFAIHSIRKAGIDPEQSENMQALQRYLQALLSGLPHLYAVPLPARDPTWSSFFNPAFAREAPPLAAPRDRGADEWLFVLSREDYIFLAGFEREAFHRALEARLQEVLSHPRARLRFVGPPELGRFLQARWPGEARIEHVAFCDFETFESLVRGAKVVAYWNILSSTLLYCLYYRVPPVFFGQGHQAKVLPGLYDHAVEHLYRGRAPRLLDLAQPIEPDANALIEHLEIGPWLDAIRTDYAGLPAPAAVIDGIVRHHVQ